MPLIQWGPALELGIPEIDRQHKSIIDLANVLFDELSIDAHSERARKAVAELFAYSLTHFADEEAYFERFNFPDTSKHKKSHMAFMAEISFFEEQIASDKTLNIEEMLVFLKNWIERHIGGEDRKLLRMATSLPQRDSSRRTSS